MTSLTFRNHSSSLASNFNYSFIKKRFIMLTRKKSLVRTFIKGTVLVPVFALLAIVASCSKDHFANNFENLQSEWWQPILQKHGLELKAYNNFERVFEMGDQISINDSICTLTNAVAIIKCDDGDDYDYLICEAVYIEHNLNSNVLTITPGIGKGYKLDSDLSNPILSFKASDFIVHLKK